MVANPDEIRQESSKNDLRIKWDHTVQIEIPTLSLIFSIFYSLEIPLYACISIPFFFTSCIKKEWRDR